MNRKFKNFILSFLSVLAISIFNAQAHILDVDIINDQRERQPLTRPDLELTGVFAWLYMPGHYSNHDAIHHYTAEMKIIIPKAILVYIDGEFNEQNFIVEVIKTCALWDMECLKIDTDSPFFRERVMPVDPKNLPYIRDGHLHNHILKGLFFWAQTAYAQYSEKSKSILGIEQRKEISIDLIACLILSRDQSLIGKGYLPKLKNFPIDQMYFCNTIDDFRSFRPAMVYKEFDQHDKVLRFINPDYTNDTIGENIIWPWVIKEQRRREEEQRHRIEEYEAIMMEGRRQIAEGKSWQCTFLVGLDKKPCGAINPILEQRCRKCYCGRRPF